MTVRLNTSTNLKGSSADRQTSLIQNYMTATALLEVKLMLAECDPPFSSPYAGVFELPKRDECFLHITSIHKCTAGSAVTAETAPPDLGWSILWFSNRTGSNLSLSTLPGQRWCPFWQNAQVWPTYFPPISSSISVAYFSKACRYLGSHSHAALKVISCDNPGLSFPAVARKARLCCTELSSASSLSQLQHQVQCSNILTACSQAN